MAEHHVAAGISLSGQYVGLAVVKDNELIDWRMKVFKKTSPKRKLRKVWRAIESLIDRHEITVVAVKLPHPSLRTEGIEDTLKYITEKILEKDIPLFFYDIYTIEKYHLPYGTRNKTALAAKMAEKYPVLKTEYQRLANSSYSMKIFEAVAVIDLALADFLKR